VRVAREAIGHVLGHASTRLFAYPFREAPDYLVRDYFPTRQRGHGHLAATH